MKTEKEKMLSGELYDALDKQLSDERMQARLLIKALNDSREDQVEERARLLKKLIPNAGSDLWLQPPFIVTMEAIWCWAKRCFLTSIV